MPLNPFGNISFTKTVSTGFSGVVAPDRGGSSRFSWYAPPPQVSAPPQSTPLPSIGWTGIDAIDSFVSQLPSALYGKSSTQAMTTAITTITGWNQVYSDGLVAIDSSGASLTVHPSLADHVISVTGTVTWDANSSGNRQIWVRETLYDTTTRQFQIGGVVAPSSGVTGANFEVPVFVGHGTTAVNTVEIQARVSALTSPPGVTGARLSVYQVR